MKKSLRNIAAEINRKNRKKRIWQRVVSILCCITVFCTTYALILPAISLEMDKAASTLSNSADIDALSLNSGVELLKKIEKIDGGDLSDTVHWVVEDVTDAFDAKIRRVRIYGEGDMPNNLPWRSIYGIQKAIVEDGITSVAGTAFQGMSALTSVELGKDVKTIWGDMLKDSPNVTELKLNEGLEAIKGALNAGGLKSLVIPKTVTSLADNFLDYCSNLKYFAVEEGNTVYSSDPDHKSLLSADGKMLIKLIPTMTGEYKIPDTVETIGTAAIYNCAISSIIIPDSVKKIYDKNFNNCYNITELNFPQLSSLSSVEGNLWGRGTISSCNKLAKVTFEGFDDYSGVAFANMLSSCPMLSEVNLPDEAFNSITQLGVYAFSSTALSNDFFEKFVNLEQLPNHEVEKASSVFTSCYSMNRILLGENLTTIGAKAFNICRNVKEIILNSPDLNIDTKNSSGSAPLQSLSSCHKLTIGKTVNKLNKSIMDAIFANDITDVVFEGPNVLEIDSGISAPAPYDSLDGKYYVDESGVLYKLETDEDGNNTATLSVFPTGSALTSYTVPASVTAGETSYNVTKVGIGAFKNSSLESVTFDNPSAVTISNTAFYGSKNLTSVNSNTNITDVESLFAKVGISAFYGTALQGYLGGNDQATKSDTALTLKTSYDTEENAFKVTITNDDSIYSLYTGQTKKITVSISNPKGYDNEDEKIARIYLDFRGTDYAMSSKVGETETGEEGLQYTLYQSDIDGIYYYQFECPAHGKTGSFTFTMQYNSPKSAGGTVQVWGDLYTEEEIETLSSGVDFATTGEEYSEYTWTTVPRNLSVNETASGGSFIGSGSNEPKVYVKDIKFSISPDTSNTGRDDINSGLALDLIRSFSFKNTFTLPDGFQFDEEIINAVKDGKYYISYYATGQGSNWVQIWNVYATVNGEDIPILQLNSSNSWYGNGVPKMLTNPIIEFDEENPKQMIIKYDILNNDSSTEIQDYKYYITFGKDLCYTTNSITQGDTFEFSNTVEATNNYSFSEPQTSEKTASVTVTAGEPKLTLTKTDSYGTKMSEDHTYKINVSNDSASTYTDFSYLKDELPQYIYIPAENMLKMLGEEFGKRLTITITDAEIAKNSNSIRTTATTVDGNECKITNQNTGWNIPYSGTAPDGADADNFTAGQTITIYWDGDVLYAEYNGVEKQVDTNDSSSLGTILDEFGYYVTKAAKYTLKWDFSDYPLYGGSSFDLNVYSKAMDTFMMLYFDHDGTYQDNEVLIYQNYVKAYKSDDEQITSANTKWQYKHYREIALEHAIFKNGEVLGDNSTLSDGDVLDHTSLFKHYSNNNSGTYGALPLVDKLSSNQRLLVRKDLNESNTDLENFEVRKINGVEYYVLKYSNANPSTLTNVYTNSGELASKIELKSDGTLIHWYFDNLPTSEYIKSVDYKTLVDVSDVTDAKWEIKNESWLNDHQTHRLHVAGGVGGLSVGFDKKIVTNPDELGIGDFVTDNPILAAELETLNAKQKLDTFSLVGEGDSVTYRLSLTSTGSSVVINGENMYDTMPWKYDWQAADITVKYVYEDGKVTVENPDSWSVVKVDPSTPGASESADYRYLTWGDDFSVSLNANSELAIYVTLKFPTDAKWDTFATDNGGATLVNQYYLYGMHRDVTHELKLPVEARIQKGVYDTGSCQRDYREIPTNASYNRGSTRQYYMNKDARARFISYYATISNNGLSKLYLEDMQDVLPKGFKYYKLLNSTSIGLSTINVIQTENRGSNSPIANIEGAKFVNANVSASVSDRSETSQKITFKFSTADALESAEALKYDATVKKYYLEPGEAIRFGYLCSIGDAADTEDVAKNTLALPIVEHFDSEVRVNGNVTEVTDNGIIETNDGSCNVISNDVADSLGFNGYGSNVKWYSSDVSVSRGDIVPEISKQAMKIIKNDADKTSYDYSGYAAPDDTVIWKVTMENNGEYSLTDYTVTDTMEVPYQFEGDIRYALYDGTGAINLPYQSTVPMLLLTIERDSSGSITKVYNNQNYQSDGNFEITNFEYGHSYDEHCNIRSSTGEGYSGWKFSFKIDKDDETGQETLTLHFYDSMWSIPAGGRGELQISVAEKDKTKKESGLYRNDVQLIPNTENATNSELINYDRVISSEKVRSSDDNSVIGVAASSFINVINAYATSSVKSVTEVDSVDNLTDNTTTSNDQNNTITLKSAESKFEYKSTVKLPKDVPTKKFTMIDTLPEIGDHAAFNTEDLRGSEFKVNFIDYTPVVIMVDKDGNETTLTAGDYTIDYSDQTEFSSDDWNGTSSWSDTVDPTTHRAIRLQVTKEIPSEATINLYYRAVAAVPSVVKYGQIAYSSFGYRYQVYANNTLVSPQDAAPLKVGVRAPNIPYLAKQFSTRDGEEYAAKKDETVKFIIYEGDSIGLTGGNVADLAAKLGETAFTVVTLNVNEGETKSESISLDSLKKFTYNSTTGEFEESSDDWTWTEDSKYTIYEYSYDSDSFLFSSFGKSNKSNFTFTYLPATVQHYVCDNVLKSWQISIVKKDSDDENVKLQGAVFGLYSTDESQKITAEALAAYVTQFGLDSAPSTTETVMIDGVATTVYLTDIKSTDEFGVASWNGLLNQRYAVKELKAPDGYMIIEDADNLNLRLISMPADISLDSYTSVAAYTNKSYYVLPQTGGMGTALFTIGGIVLIASAVMFYVYVKRRKFERRVEK